MFNAITLFKRTITHACVIQVFCGGVTNDTTKHIS